MGKILNGLERKQDLPLNFHIASDGKYGVNLYRANFIPSLTRPRQRYAQCPVQAVVLMRDAFVSPDYILKGMPKWVEQFEYVELDANHWAMLSEPQKWQTIFVSLLGLNSQFNSMVAIKKPPLHCHERWFFYQLTLIRFSV